MKLVTSVAREHRIDGFTLTGGDPFYQPEALKELIPRLKEYSDDILCYSGYEEKILREREYCSLQDLLVLVRQKQLRH